MSYFCYNSKLNMYEICWFFLSKKSLQNIFRSVMPCKFDFHLQSSHQRVFPFESLDILNRGLVRGAVFRQDGAGPLLPLVLAVKGQLFLMDVVHKAWQVSHTSGYHSGGVHGIVYIHIIHLTYKIQFYIQVTHLCKKYKT